MRSARIQSNQDPADRPNLYLVGFMGTGKSTVARILADRIGLRWYDSDAEIERAEQKSIPDIFAEKGETAFRELERVFIEHGHPDRGCVVSCGGGMVTLPGMVERLKSRGVLICLLASAHSIHERTRFNQNRPLLNVEDPEARIEAMLKEREPFYRQCGTQILTDFRPLPDVARHAARVYQRESREFDRARRG